MRQYLTEETEKNYYKIKSRKLVSQPRF